MTTLKILVTNQKGGVGKSSLSANLAAYFAIERDVKTTLLDFDRQATSSQWIANAKSHPLLSAINASNVIHGGNRLSLFNARSTVRSASTNCRVLIGDITWSPIVGPEILSVFDLVLIPSSLSELELLSTIGLLKDLRIALTMPGAPKLILCPNKIHPFQRKFNALSAQRFPVPFLLAPAITQSKEFEDLHQKDFIVRSSLKDVRQRFRNLGRAIEAAAGITPEQLQGVVTQGPTQVPPAHSVERSANRFQSRAPANNETVLDQPDPSIPAIIRKVTIS